MNLLAIARKPSKFFRKYKLIDSNANKPSHAPKWRMPQFCKALGLYYGGCNISIRNILDASGNANASINLSKVKDSDGLGILNFTGESKNNKGAMITDAMKVLRESQSSSRFAVSYGAF